MGEDNAHDDESRVRVKDRLNSYQRRVDLALYLGTGYAGLLVLLSTDIFDEAPTILIRLIATLVLLGAGAVGMARVGFGWQRAKLQAKVEREGVEEQGALSKAIDEWPMRAEIYWYVALLAITAAGILALAGIWWPD